VKAVADKDINRGDAPVDHAPVPVSLRMALRAATAVDHETVDSAFERFDLASAPSYAQFLMAHARVLGAMEGVAAGLWPMSIARFPLLQADLADLDIAVTEDESGDAFSEAERWGVGYVLEGSRLGGGILSGRVAAGLPVRYLSATHASGSWRSFGEAMDLAGDQGGGLPDDDWRAAVISGAKSTFAQFAGSALEARQ
jgi:heme oxygenase